jgi:Flp pilus assembly protein TadB
MDYGYNVRVGDADREAAAAQLREHYADGRLTLDELNERLDQAFAAKTKADLNGVLADLPQAAGTPRGGPGWSAPGVMTPAGAGWDYRDRAGGDGRQAGRRAAFAPLISLAWLCVIIAALFLFNIGGGGKPLLIVLFLAVVAFLRRLFGLSRRGGRRPRGPRRRF